MSPSIILRVLSTVQRLTNTSYLHSTGNWAWASRKGTSCTWYPRLTRTGGRRTGMARKIRPSPASSLPSLSSSSEFLPKTLWRFFCGSIQLCFSGGFCVTLAYLLCLIIYSCLLDLVSSFWYFVSSFVSVRFLLLHRFVLSVTFLHYCRQLRYVEDHVKGGQWEGQGNTKKRFFMFCR